MLGGVLLLTVGGVILYAGFTDYWNRPWELITETLGGAPKRRTAGAAAPRPAQRGGAR